MSSTASHHSHADLSQKRGRFDHTSILSLWLYDTFDLVMFVQNAVGSLSAAPIQLVIWWAVSSVVTGLLELQPYKLFGIPVGWKFLFLFHTTRCTVSYALYILREIIDHGGLHPISIMAFTRTSPCRRFLQIYLQPHDDNYHMLHHMLPKIPTSRLHKADEWLVEHCEEYAKTNRKCSHSMKTVDAYGLLSGHTTYVSGDKPLFNGDLHHHG